jgi:hypothetical protein
VRVSRLYRWFVVQWIAYSMLILPETWQDLSLPCRDAEKVPVVVPVEDVDVAADTDNSVGCDDFAQPTGTESIHL